MNSDFSHMGFSANGPESAAALLARSGTALRRLPRLAGGACAALRPDDRIELWFPLRDSEPDPKGCELCYHAGTAVTVTPEAEIRAPRLPWPLLLVECSICPLHVIVPSAAARKVVLQEPCAMEITLFPQRLAIYSDEEAYYRESGSHMAAESILPLGTFRNAEKQPLEAAVAQINGVVTEVLSRTNPLTGLSYFALALECRGSRFTVVAAPTLFTVPPRVGSIVSGLFRLTGEVLQ